MRRIHIVYVSAIVSATMLSSCRSSTAENRGESGLVASLDGEEMVGKSPQTLSPEDSKVFVDDVERIWKGRDVVSPMSGVDSMGPTNDGGQDSLWNNDRFVIMNIGPITDINGEEVGIGFWAGTNRAEMRPDSLNALKGLGIYRLVKKYKSETSNIQNVSWVELNLIAKCQRTTTAGQAQFSCELSWRYTGGA
jgi:hypothetical protein